MLELSLTATFEGLEEGTSVLIKGHWAGDQRIADEIIRPEASWLLIPPGPGGMHRDDRDDTPARGAAQ